MCRKEIFQSDLNKFMKNWRQSSYLKVKWGTEDQEQGTGVHYHQISTGGLIQHNKEIKKKEKYSDWKGRSKTLFIHRQHSCAHKKS